MKTRQEIKEQAKYAFSQQRGVAILMPVVIALVSTGGSAVGMLPYIGWAISLAVGIIMMVLSIGMNGGFIKIYKEEKIDIAEPFNSLSVNFLRKVGSMLLMTLLLMLWTLLLIVPGIIMSYAYFLVPYILADCPKVAAVDAIKISRRMMDGNKMNIFVAHLSFIPWVLPGIFSVFLLGVGIGAGIALFNVIAVVMMIGQIILGLVYVTPYYSTTMAGYYAEIKSNALALGVVSEDELYDTPSYYEGRQQ